MSVPGLSMDIDVKKEVRHSEPFVQLLRTRLAFHLGELYQEVSSFCQELVDQDLARRPESKGVVLIVDSLEKLRDVSSVRDLFVLDSDKLSFPSHHVVYTVPPVLQFTAPGSLPFDAPVRSVPVPHVRDRDGGRFEAGIEQLREVVARRVSWEQLLGDQALLDEVVLASGGHLGDLFRSVAEIVTSAHGRGADLPVGRQLVDDALAEVARGFSSITAENANCLRRVHGQREQVEFGSNEVERLAGLLDTHMLLAHLNGDTWYEVHPLARRTLGLE